jgi:hypothetical protein
MHEDPSASHMENSIVFKIPSERKEEIQQQLAFFGITEEVLSSLARIFRSGV